MPHFNLHLTKITMTADPLRPADGFINNPEPDDADAL